MTWSSIGPMTSQISVQTSLPGSAQGPRVLALPEHGAVGVVVDHDELGAPPQEDGEAGRQADADRGPQALRPRVRGAERPGRPVGALDELRHLARRARRRGRPPHLAAAAPAARQLQDDERRARSAVLDGSQRGLPGNPVPWSAVPSTSWTGRTVTHRAAQGQHRSVGSPQVRRGRPPPTGDPSAELVVAAGGAVPEHAQGVDDARRQPRPGRRPLHRRARRSTCARRRGSAGPGGAG